jgi:hypothetical protein
MLSTRVRWSNVHSTVLYSIVTIRAFQGISSQGAPIQSNLSYSGTIRNDRRNQAEKKNIESESAKLEWYTVTERDLQVERLEGQVTSDQKSSDGLLVFGC